MNKRTYCLLYHGSIPVTNIVPVLNVDQLLEQTNIIIKQKNCNPGGNNLLAKLVRLNWMVNDLKSSPIYKPILTVLRQGNLVTATGDTRLQAIELLPNITHIACLASIPINMQENFKYWDLVDNKQTLASYLNTNINDIIVNQDWNIHELDWIEFSFDETSNHMHDEDQRLRMIYNYLDRQPKDFRFTRKWLQTLVNWDQYDY